MSDSAFYSALLIDADALNDLEKVRIATQNRIQALTSEHVEGENGGSFGKNLAGSPEEKRARVLLELIMAAEGQATKNLERSMRQHPLGPFVERTPGLGLKQVGRLLAAIGDVTWNSRDDRPRRGPAELWAYCGLHTVDGNRPRRRKGEQSNWNTDAKTRAYLVATSCMKCRQSPYREVYDRERAKWSERNTTELHKHNHALGVVAKEVLKDLWREARAKTDASSKGSPPALVSEASPIVIHIDEGELARQVIGALS